MKFLKGPKLLHCLGEGQNKKSMCIRSRSFVTPGLLAILSRTTNPLDYNTIGFRDTLFGQPTLSASVPEDCRFILSIVNQYNLDANQNNAVRDHIRKLSMEGPRVCVPLRHFLMIF